MGASAPFVADRLDVLLEDVRLLEEEAESSADLLFPGHRKDDASEGGVMEERLSKRRRIQHRRFSPSSARSASQRRAEPASKSKRWPATHISGGGVCRGRSNAEWPIENTASPGQTATLPEVQLPRQQVNHSTVSSGTTGSASQALGAAGFSIPVLHSSQQPSSAASAGGVSGGGKHLLPLFSQLSSCFSNFLTEFKAHTALISHTNPVSATQSSPTDSVSLQEPAAVIWSENHVPHSHSADLLEVSQDF